MTIRMLDEKHTAVTEARSWDRQYTIARTYTCDPMPYETVTTYIPTVSGNFLPVVEHYWVCQKNHVTGKFSPIYFAGTCREDAYDVFSIYNDNEPIQLSMFDLLDEMIA